MTIDSYCLHPKYKSNLNKVNKVNKMLRNNTIRIYTNILLYIFITF